MRGYGAAEILTSICIVKPPRLGGLRIEFTIADDEAVAGEVFFPRCDLHFTELLRREAEERLAGTGADRLRKSEILPNGIERDKLDPARFRAHVPKVRHAAFKLSFRPRTPDTVMVQVADCEIIGDQPSRRAVERLEIASADIGCRDFRAWKITGFCLIAEDFPAPGADHHLLAIASCGDFIGGG